MNVSRGYVTQLPLLQLMNESMNQQARYNAARAAKNFVTKQLSLFWGYQPFSRLKHIFSHITSSFHLFELDEKFHI